MSENHQRTRLHTNGAWGSRAAWAVFLAGPIGIAAGDTYLALGDSLAFGYSTFFDTPQNFGDNGYVSRFADHLAGVRGTRPEVVNFAVPGESVEEFFGGSGFGYLYNRNYFDLAAPLDGPLTTQAELLAGVLAEHESGARTITNVTVQIGVNDLFQLADTPGFFDQSLGSQLAAVNAALVDIVAGVDAMLADIRASAPGADVRVVGYYNPFAILPSDPLSPLADLATSPLNESLRATALANGASFVDVFDLFAGRESELTRILTIDALGDANIHPTEAGYDVLAEAIIAVPAPSAMVIFGLGVVCSARRRR